MCCPPYITGPDPGISARLMHVGCMTHMHLTTLSLRTACSIQSTAKTACQEMGFGSGFFGDEVLGVELLPPWLSGIRCAGPEPGVGACRRSSFGNTSPCGTTLRLFCFSSRVALPHESSAAASVLPIFVLSAHGRVTQHGPVQLNVVFTWHVAVGPSLQLCTRPSDQLCTRTSTARPARQMSAPPSRGRQRSCTAA